MKKILLGILVFAGMTSYSQTSETLLEGTIIKTATGNSLTLVQDKETGKVYKALPSHVTLPAMAVGAEVAFTLKYRSDGDTASDQMRVSNTPKSRHDSMMATIQNTR